jgi:rhodanese-related sulfurtransferase
MISITSSVYKKALIVVGILGLGVLLTLATPLRHIPLLTPTIHDIAPEAFQQLYLENPDQYVFIDVRSEESYNRIHAEGSKLMSLHTLYDEWRNLPRNTDKTVVLICSGGRASGVGYHYLEHHGFFNIMRIGGGIEAWQLAGLPVVTND